MRKDLHEEYTVLFNQIQTKPTPILSEEVINFIYRLQRHEESRKDIAVDLMHLSRKNEHEAKELRQAIQVLELQLKKVSS